MKITGSVYLLGDIHWNWKRTFYDIERFDLSDCTIICVGDIGWGFDNCGLAEANVINNRLSQRGITFLGVRGNHEDKKFFDGETINLPFLKMLPDYSRLNVNGENWLLIGGAISIDRFNRIQGRSYWADEDFVLDESKIGDAPVDVLVTHSGPNWIGPNDCTGIVKACVDVEAKLGLHTLWPELQAERIKHDRLLEIVKPKKLYLGHFHQRCEVTKAWSDGEKTKARILAENELLLHEGL